MPFTFTPTEIPDVILITPRVFGDDRGFFLETYKRSEFESAGITGDFVQDNHSQSVRGVIRGLHYQVPPAAQAKLVRTVRGRVWDVAVDIRKASPTFGQWVGTELSADNHALLYIPEGFAHGFAVISDIAEVEYKVTSEYSPEHERGIAWNDPELAIDWPINNPIVSNKDLQLPLLQHLFEPALADPF
jgi:dTDP-4-dehydrorhamnose 3,5-epimerase